MCGSHALHRPAALYPCSATLLDIDIAAGMDLTLSTQSGAWGIALLLTGSLQLDSREIEAPGAALFDGPELLAKLASQTGASVL